MKKLCFFGLSLIFISFAHSSSAAETDADKRERVLTIQGQGKVYASPDVATLSIEVSQDGKDLDAILNQARQRMNKILEVIKTQGIQNQDVQTELFQVHPKMEWDKHGNPQPAGYSVTHRVSVKVRNLGITGEVLAAVLNAGATNVYGPDLEIDKPEVAEERALAAATRDAAAKAQAVADAAGVKLGNIVTINPQSVYWPNPPRPLFMRAMAMPAAAPTEEPIAAGEQTISGTVTLTYAIHS